MTRACGTYVKYKLDGCRCVPCRTANRTYGRQNRQKIAPSYVAAGPAREHCRELMAAGVGLKQIIKTSGVSSGAIWKLLYGKGGRPSRRIRRDTEQRILAVTPADTADGALVDAAPTWLLIDQMTAAGVPRVRIAEHIGQTGPGLQLSRRRVTAGNARSIKDLHTAWCTGTVHLHRGSRHTGPVTIPPPPPPPRRGQADISDLYHALADIIDERREQAEWRQNAACRGRGAWMWFPTRGDRVTLDAALKVCAACIVRTQCRAANIDQPVGVYGGLTAQARHQLRAADQNPAV